MTSEAPVEDEAVGVVARGGSAGAGRRRHPARAGSVRAGGTARLGAPGTALVPVLAGRRLRGRPGRHGGGPAAGRPGEPPEPGRPAGPLGRVLVPARRRTGVATPPADVPRPRVGQHHRLLPRLPDLHPMAGRRHQAVAPRGRCGGQRHHRPGGRGVRRPAGPAVRRERAGHAGDAALRGVPGHLRVQPDLRRRDHHHLRRARAVGPAAAPVVAGRTARAGGHRDLTDRPRLRPQLRLVCRLGRLARPERAPARGPGPRAPGFRRLHGLAVAAHRRARTHGD